MRTLFKLLLIATLAQSSLALAQAISTKEAIATYFGADGKPPQLKRQKSGGVVEVCFDTCDFYRFVGSVDEQVVWDIVFIHQYFLNTPYHLRKFKTDYQDVSSDVLARYKSLCPSILEDKLPICILDNLAKSHRASYAFVRYDEGYRCEVAGRFTNPSFEGKSSCTKYRHVP